MKQAGLGKWIAIIVFSLCLVECLAQKAEPESRGSGILERGGILAGTLVDAGLTDFNKSFLFASVQRKYLIKELNARSVMAGLPVRKGVMAISYSDYGMVSYREYKAAIHYAIKLNPGIRCGVRMIWYRSAYKDIYYQDKDHYSFAVSVQSSAGKKSVFGFQVENAIMYPEELFPESGLKPAIRFYGENHISSVAKLKAWVAQSKGEKTMAGLGFQLIHKERFLIAAGLQLHPGSFYFSTGWRLRGLMLHIRTDWHPVLGFSPETSFYTGKGGQ
jgi:hypothetical protein